MTSGVRDLSYTFGSQVAMAVLGVATQSMLAWWLGTADRGSYAACLVFSTLLNVVFVVGFDVAIEVFTASGRLTPAQAFTDTMLCGALSSLVALAAGLIALHTSIPLFEKATPRQFLLALAWMPMAMVANVLVRIPAALRRFGLAAFLQAGQFAMQLVATVLFVGVLGAGVEGAILAGMTMSLVTLVIAPALLFRNAGPVWARPSWSRLRDIRSFGVRYYVGKLSNLVHVELGTMIVAMFVEREAIGVFAVAAMLASRSEMIPNVVQTVVLPRVATDERGRPELIAQCVRLTFLVCAVLLGGLFVLADWVVPILFSPAFQAAVPLLRIILAGTLVRCASKVVVPYLIARNRPGLASVAVFSGVVVNAVGLFALLPVLGLPGAALAVTLNHAVSSVILLQGFQAVSGMRARELWAFSRADWAPVGRLLRRLGRSGQGDDFEGGTQRRAAS